MTILTNCTDLIRRSIVTLCCNLFMTSARASLSGARLLSVANNASKPRDKLYYYPRPSYSKKSFIYHWSQKSSSQSKPSPSRPSNQGPSWCWMSSYAVSRNGDCLWNSIQAPNRRDINWVSVPVCAMPSLRYLLLLHWSWKVVIENQSLIFNFHASRTFQFSVSQLQFIFCLRFQRNSL